MESIVIRNFGPIESVEIREVKKITVFIGESGSGKSTIMKVLALFRWLYKMMNIRSFLKYSQIPKSPFRFQFISLLRSSGLIEYLRDDSVLEYGNGSLHLRWDSTVGKLTGTTSYIPKEELSLEKISFISDKRNLIPDMLDGSIALKRETYYVNETYSDFEMAVAAVHEMPISNLGVKFVTRKTGYGMKYLIVPEDGSNSFSVGLRASSSGTQNIVPLNVIVEYYARHYDLVSSINKAVLSYVSKSDSLSDFTAVKNIGDFTNRNVHLFIEEPELSLFPSSQSDLMDFLTESIYDERERGYGISLMMATHSPYIVNYLNVLLRRAYRADLQNGSFVRPEDLAVYRVYDGRIQNLVGTGDEARVLVDTHDLSDEMEVIYREYTELVR